MQRKVVPDKASALDELDLSDAIWSCPALNPEEDKLRGFGLRLTAAI